MKRLFAFALAGIAGMAGTFIGLPASAAPAASNTLVVSGEFTPNGAAHYGGTVHCPAGYRMVGSGARADGRLGLDAISALIPTADFTGATLFVNNITQPQDPERVATLDVTCAPASQFSDVIVVQTNDHGIRPGTFSEGISRCPAGYFGFGGGGAYFANGTGIVGAAASNTTNAPSADGSAWTYAGVAPAGATMQEVIIQCAPRTGHDFLVQFGPVATSSLLPTIGVVTCPTGYTAIAGGFYVSNLNGSVSAVGNVQRSSLRGSPDTWIAIGWISIDTTKMVALAQCLF
jgi:hypothetical protein